MKFSKRKALLKFSTFQTKRDRQRERNREFSRERAYEHNLCITLPLFEHVRRSISLPHFTVLPSKLLLTREKRIEKDKEREKQRERDKDKKWRGKTILVVPDKTTDMKTLGPDCWTNFIDYHQSKALLFDTSRLNQSDKSKRNTTSLSGGTINRS